MNLTERRRGSVGLRFDYGGFRRPRRVTFSVQGRGQVLRLYRHALRRYGRRDGWTEDIEAAVAAGDREFDIDIVGSDCKQFVGDLQEMGLRDFAIDLDSFAWQPDIAAAEERHEAELAAMTSLV